MRDERRQRGIAPTILIELPVEGRPRVKIACQNDGERLRLTDWIASHDDLFDLVVDAIRIATEEAA
jgi:hypothetical protein